MASIPFKDMMQKPVKDFLPKNHVVHCGPNTVIKDILTVLRNSEIGSIVITEKNKPLGIFTERDFIKKIAGHNFDLAKEPVKNHMTPNPVSVPHTEPIGQILMKMQAGGFRHMLVLNENKELSDIVSIKDIMGFLVDSLLEELVGDYRKSA